MAITIGNKTANIGIPAATTQTFAHNSNGGTNQYLYVVTAMSNATTYASITYGGVPMTKIQEQTTSVSNTRLAFWQLANPANGNNNVIITFGQAQWNNVSSFAFTTSGANGFGNIVFDNTASSPNSTSISVSNNSIVFGLEISGNGATNSITIDGSNRTLEYTHNVNNYASGAISQQLTAGSKTVSVAGLSDVVGYYFEILEFAAVVVSTNNSSFLMFV